MASLRNYLASKLGGTQATAYMLCQGPT